MQEVWQRKDLKRTAKGNLKRNFLACFVVGLILTFITNGPMAITQTVNSSKEDLTALSVLIPSESFNNGINSLIKGIDYIGEVTDIGDDSTKGALHSVYSLASEAQSIPQILKKLISAIIEGSKASTYVSIALSLATLLFIKVFIQNILLVGGNRFFLQNRLYQNTKITNLLYVFRIKRTKHIALIVVMKYVFLFFWAFTIVGFFVKRYSYYMVTYIAAENPEISLKDAFDLSIKMMDGNKWRVFLLEMSFLPWYLLSIVTFGILSYLYLNPYIYATKAELYAAVRKSAYERKIENVELLDDKYLFELPAEGLIAEQDYEEGVYPSTYSKFEISKGREWLHVTPKDHYSIINLLFMFFVFSFIGWAWECLLEYYKIGIFVNRGSMWGPWIPIYGAGGLMMIILLNRFRAKPLVTFFSSIVVAGIMEYTTAAILWNTQHLKYWDYTGYFLNIQGRICLEGLLFFGIMGLAGIYFFAPLTDNVLEKIPIKIRRAIITFLIIAFLADKTAVTIEPRTGRGLTYGGE